MLLNPYFGKYGNNVVSVCLPRGLDLALYIDKRIYSRDGHPHYQRTLKWLTWCSKKWSRMKGELAMWWPGYHTGRVVGAAISWPVWLRGRGESSLRSEEHSVGLVLLRWTGGMLGQWHTCASRSRRTCCAQRLLHNFHYARRRAACQYCRLWPT